MRLNHWKVNEFDDGDVNCVESNLRALSDLEGLDISSNKLKDLDSVIGNSRMMNSQF